MKGFTESRQRRMTPASFLTIMLRQTVGDMRREVRAKWSRAHRKRARDLGGDRIVHATGDEDAVENPALVQRVRPEEQHAPSASERRQESFDEEPSRERADHAVAADGVAKVFDRREGRG